MDKTPSFQKRSLLEKVYCGVIKNSNGRLCTKYKIKERIRLPIGNLVGCYLIRAAAVIKEVRFLTLKLKICCWRLRMLEIVILQFCLFENLKNWKLILKNHSLQIQNLRLKCKEFLCCSRTNKGIIY